MQIQREGISIFLYRNSKLARLLKDYLGGNCQTVMTAAVRPSSLFSDDTYNTLKYASHTKDIKPLKSDVLNVNSHISQYVKICNVQKAEILMLKEKLKAYEEQKALTDENDSVKTVHQTLKTKKLKDFKKFGNACSRVKKELGKNI